MEGNRSKGSFARQPHPCCNAPLLPLGDAVSLHTAQQMVQPNVKTKQWDTVLKFKTSQDKFIVVVYHADVKMKPDPAETL